jgi:hypothetical protein
LALGILIFFKIDKVLAGHFLWYSYF